MQQKCVNSYKFSSKNLVIVIDALPIYEPITEANRIKCCDCICLLTQLFPSTHLAQVSGHPYAE